VHALVEKLQFFIFNHFFPFKDKHLSCESLNVEEIRVIGDHCVELSQQPGF
jgi:hypothetical protein